MQSAAEINLEIKTLQHAYNSLALMQVEVWVEMVLGNVSSSDSSEYKSEYGLKMSRKAFTQATSLSEPRVQYPARTLAHFSNADSYRAT